MAEQELNEKLAKWRWPDAHTILVNPSGIHVWLSNDAGGIDEYYSLWFTRSLDACFRWLIPMVSGWEMGSTHDGRVSATVWDNKMVKTRRGFDKEPAMALCKAFEELRKEG